MINPRKILILTNRIPYPLNDGGNLAVQAMIEGYHNAGWQVYLLAMNTSRHYVEPQVLQQLFLHIHSFEWVDIDNHVKTMEVLKNFLFSKEPEHAARFNKKEFKDKLKEILVSFTPDVVQVESVYLSTYLPVIKKYAAALTVLRVHNIEYLIWKSVSGKQGNWLKRIYLYNLAMRIRSFEKAAWPQYDLLLAITNKDAELLARMGGNIQEMIVAPFSIDTKAIAPGRNEKWVGYHIGAMDWHANRHGIKWFLAKVWPKIRKVAPGFEFYFAGRAMPEEFNNLGIKGVHCMNEVPSAEDFIADKKILMVPVWSAGGIRVKILEAMAAGKIVIATPVGIRGIEAKPREHFLLAKNSDEFASAVKWCLDNKEDAEKMALNARQLMQEKYDNTTVIAGVITEVERLLADRL